MVFTMTEWIKGPVKLKYNDTVIFKVNDKQLIYSVNHNHLNSPDGNDEIFRLLSLDRYSFATAYYGYRNNVGNWPESKKDDMEALSRLVNELFKLTKQFKANWSLK